MSTATFSSFSLVKTSEVPPAMGRPDGPSRFRMARASDNEPGRWKSMILMQALSFAAHYGVSCTFTR